MFVVALTELRLDKQFRAWCLGNSLTAVSYHLQKRGSTLCSKLFSLNVRVVGWATRKGAMCAREPKIRGGMYRSRAWVPPHTRRGTPSPSPPQHPHPLASSTSCACTRVHSRVCTGVPLSIWSRLLLTIPTMSHTLHGGCQYGAQLHHPTSQRLNGWRMDLKLGVDIVVRQCERSGSINRHV